MEKKHIRKIQIVRIILVILIIINCLVIFKFSSEQSEKSDNRSGVVVEKIIELNPENKKLSSEELAKKKEKIVTPVRKTAHFTVYTCLGVLLYTFSKTFKGKEKWKVLASILLAFLYACSDEVHQYFVPGRSCEFRDVCIDTCGVVFGIIIVSLIYGGFRVIRKKQ